LNKPPPLALLEGKSRQRGVALKMTHCRAPGNQVHDKAAGVVAGGWPRTIIDF